MDRRRMCPNCRAFISSDDRVCQYCGFELRPASSTPSADAAGGLIPEHAFTTFMLLVVNGAMWAVSVMLSKQAGNPRALMDIDMNTLVSLGGKWSELIRHDGQWWRLVTAGFLHGGLFHILMNGWAMVQLGRQIDVIFGSARYLVIFFAATVGGFWLSTFESPRSMSVGASAGLCGIIGAMIAVGFLSRSNLALELRRSYIRYAIFVMAFGFVSTWLGWWPIDNMAHLGGIIGGFAAAMVTGLPRPANPIRDRFWTLAAWACVLVTAFCFYLMLGNYTQTHPTFRPSPQRMVRPLPTERL
ncbi:MAG TPA: rhomboid family intramembrane serine protease [Bryobacteraceae bacterium]|jgi:rhomboid protease GluP